MDMSSHEPDPAVVNLPLSDPRCVLVAEDCLAFYAAENDSQAVTPFAGQFEYGHWLTYYYVCLIFIFMSVYFFHLWQDYKSKPEPTGSPRSSVSIRTRLMAAGRYLSYRRVNIRSLNWLGLPSFGVLALLMMTLVVVTCLVFAARPYYRPHFGFGGPPIAIRCGLMAFACIPILIALAGKANIVTLLTGVSHEKLNILHQWVAWISLVLSLIHTIPFFVASIDEAKDKQTSISENVAFEFYRSGDLVGILGQDEYSGVPPLAILFGLCIFSLPIIRKRAYETFYATHVLMAITYVGLLFWHAGNVLDSWSYLWATIALWLASYLARAFWFTRPLNIHSQWLVGSPAALFQMPGGMTRIEVVAPPGFKWRPSQHVFLRFPKINALDNHPFTIVSAPDPENTESDKVAKRASIQDSPSLVFLARAQAGFTRKLAHYCGSNPDALANAWVDGPYGGVTRPIESLFDTMILVAGGAGITACMPWIKHVLTQSQLDPNPVKVKKMFLVWIMKEADHFAWVKRLLEDASAHGIKELALVMNFFITDSASKGPSQAQDNEEKNDAIEAVTAASDRSTSMTSLGSVVHERPDISKLVSGMFDAGRTFVFACGPDGLRNDLSNAVAAVQGRAMKGEIQEVALHTEAFGW